MIGTRSKEEINPTAQPSRYLYMRELQTDHRIFDWSRHMTSSHGLNLFPSICNSASAGFFCLSFLNRPRKIHLQSQPVHGSFMVRYRGTFMEHQTCPRGACATLGIIDLNRIHSGYFP